MSKPVMFTLWRRAGFVPRVGIFSNVQSALKKNNCCAPLKGTTSIHLLHASTHGKSFVLCGRYLQTYIILCIRVGMVSGSLS